MRHYYNDEGIIQHTWKNRNLLCALTEAFEPYNQKDHVEMRSRCMETAIEVMYAYNIHKDLAGIGGCVDVNTWRNQKSENKVEEAVKNLFLEFLDEGFIPSEFKLAIWDAVCEIQLYLQV